jgi:glycosyltransferase involved in cell wall biosynthesis
VNLLLATDAFPPICGGSGWSTFELARGLRARGHAVIVVQPVPGRASGVEERQYEGLRVLRYGTAAPNVPYVRNYYKNERLYARLERFLSDLIARERIDIVHGQHVLTCLPSIAAAHRQKIPAVCTVRDYWPVCYWSDLIHTVNGAELCPACSSGMMTQCIRPHAGAAWPVALPMIPYMRRNLSRKRRGLAAAEAVIAVSSRMAADLRARAPELAASRIEVIPNPVDVASLTEEARRTSPRLEGPYALYVGKLAPNKGTARLVDIVERARLPWPLVVVGDGPERDVIERAARRSHQDVRLVGWAGREDTIAWLAHAAVLVFPSRGPESLSRVLLEASALGVAIAAMNTGGTADIVDHERTGLLSDTPEQLARDVERLVSDQPLRETLGAAARRKASALFDSPAVVQRIDGLYAELSRERRG